MNENQMRLMEGLNDTDRGIRLDSLRSLMQEIKKGNLEKPPAGSDVNNHIHTIYSFSPYSPAKAIWMAYTSGLETAGIMDHDSVSGAEEFIQAGRIAGIETTVGVEIRADFSGTELKGRRINNPDQLTIAYVAMHGIPHTRLQDVQDFLRPLRGARNLRNRKMTGRINGITRPFGIELDFDRDVVPLSMQNEGGGITERHLLYALAGRLVEKYGKGHRLLDFLKGELGLQIRNKAIGYLLDTENTGYLYDLLGVLKSDMVSRFYINAHEECPNVREFTRFTAETGAVSAYAYLGDVGESVTGDKKPQEFEDSYLDELFAVLNGLGFNAVTYMPSRNTFKQLQRVRSLCGKHAFFQISGEDINQPRQKFVCEALRRNEFSNLVESTWALIGHEKAATKDISKAMFSHYATSKYPSLQKRAAIYSKVGRNQMSIDNI